MGGWYAFFDPGFLNPITETYGIEWLDVEILDDDENMGRNYQPILYTFNDSEEARLLTMGLDYVYAPGCTLLNLTGNAFPVVRGNPTSYVANAPTGVDLNGTKGIAIAGIVTSSGGKILAMGSSSMFADVTGGTYAFANNTQFAENILRWFLGEPSISISEVSDTYPVAYPHTLKINYENNGTANLIDVNITLEVPASVKLLTSATQIIDNSSVGDAQVLSWSINVTSAGTYTIKVHYSAYGLAEKVYEFNITAIADTTPPTISITSPSSGTYFKETSVAITWSASDDQQLVSIIIYVDGSPEYVLDPSVTSQTLTLSEGTHTIKVEAVDWVGKTSYDEIQVKVDLTAPTVTIISPEDGATVTAGNVEIQFNITDNFEVDKIIIYVDGTNVSELPGTANSTVISLSAGDHVIVVKAIDKAGNEGTATISVTAKAAGMPPELIYGGIGVAVVIVAVLVYFFYFKKKGG